MLLLQKLLVKGCTTNGDRACTGLWFPSWYGGHQNKQTNNIQDGGEAYDLLLRRITRGFRAHLS